MQFQVTDIDLDFSSDDDDKFSPEEQQEAIENCLGCWEADDEDDLIEEITCASGWCIKSIDYHIIFTLGILN